MMKKKTVKKYQAGKQVDTTSTKGPVKPVVPPMETPKRAAADSSSAKVTGGYRITTKPKQKRGGTIKSKKK